MLLYKKKKPEWTNDLKEVEDFLKENHFEKQEDNTYILNYLGEEYNPIKHKNPPRMIVYVAPKKVNGLIRNKVKCLFKGRGTAQVMYNLMSDTFEVMIPYLKQIGYYNYD